MLVGMNAVVYRNTGSYGTPVWTPVNGIGDCQVNADWNIVKQAVRGNRVALGVKTFLDLELTWKMEASLDDASYLAIRAAVFSDEPLDLLILNEDKATIGAWGFRADFLITSHNDDQGAGSALNPEFKVIPTTATTDPLAVPSLAEVGTGPTLAYTPIA